MTEPTCGWSVDTLKEFMMALFAEKDNQIAEAAQASSQAVSAALAAQKELTNAALAAAERALLKAEVASEKRFDSVNEFRALVADQQRTLMPRSETEIVLKSLGEQMETMRTRLDTLAGKREGSQDGVSMIIGIVGFVVGLLSFVALLFKRSL